MYDRDGNRKYLVSTERGAFLAAAAQQSDAATRTFSLTLALTGARLSEVLALTPQKIDFELGAIVVRSLKKRDKHEHRPIPVPHTLLQQLAPCAVPQRAPVTAQQPLWRWGRTTGWKKIKSVMQMAGIHGPQASPKGLRHGFAVAALEAGVPLTLVSRWLGHSELATTAIYTDVIGREERAFAERMWKRLPLH